MNTERYQEQRHAMQPERPEPLAVHFEHIPERLRAYDHFVVWQYEQVEDERKKPPFDPKTGKRASVGRSETWGSFDEARNAYATGMFAGVGIVLFPQWRLLALILTTALQMN